MDSEARKATDIKEVERLLIDLETETGWMDPIEVVIIPDVRGIFSRIMDVINPRGRVLRVSLSRTEAGILVRRQEGCLFVQAYEGFLSHEYLAGTTGTTK